jgi:hypothetical protein
VSADILVLPSMYVYTAICQLLAICIYNFAQSIQHAVGSEPNLARLQCRPLHTTCG